MNPIKLLRTSLLTLGLLGILHSNIQAGEIEQRAFIERFYQNILNRTADDTGMNTWLNTIQNQSATQVAMGFLNSQELANKNLSNEEYLDILYQTLFDRQADSGGRNDWLEKMRNGRTKQSVMFGFFQSDEFKNLANKFGVTQILSTDNPSLTGVESYVDRFYRLVLKRNYDENGFNDWVNQLTNKTKNPTEIANGFLFSPEYVKQNEDNSTYLDTCYQAFFGRASDEGGKSDWLNKINQGYTRQQIFEGFTGSQEFTNLVNSFNLDNVDNEVPLITSATTFSVNENQTNAFTITATDNSTVTYSISGTDASLFNVDSTTGVVTFKTNPDFETKSSYSIKVRAMDSSNNVSTKDVTLNITDVEEIAPTITSAVTFTVNKNQTSAFTATATDTSGILSYDLSGTDSNYFNINQITGVVTFKTVANFDIKNSYFIALTATDTVNNSSNQSITINIVNLDETTPIFTSASMISVNENQTSVITAMAIDNSSVTYSISGTDVSSFNINSTTGVITFKIAPDYEIKSFYSIIVKAIDSSNNVSTQNLIINVTDVLETFQSGQTWNGFTYNIVTSPITGKKWLDRNLGASQVCASSTDSACYGDYYQWGRLADGHEKLNSGFTTGRASTITSLENHFIAVDIANSVTDWTSADSDGIERIGQWSKTDGTGICPVGFRVPTDGELINETIGYIGINNTITGAVKVIDSTTAFQNFLKFPAAGYRNFADRVEFAGFNVWTSSAAKEFYSLNGWNGVIPDYYYPRPYDGGAYAINSYGIKVYGRAYGIPIRCVGN